MTVSFLVLGSSFGLGLGLEQKVLQFFKTIFVYQSTDNIDINIPRIFVPELNVFLTAVNKTH